MTTYKAMLLGSAGAVALGLGLAATSALAFDDVNWTWNKTIDERVRKQIDIISTINPTGMTEIEKLQIYIGDVSATSTVHDIYNNPPTQDEGGTVIINEIFDFATTVDDSTDPSTVDAPVDGVGDGDSPVTATLLEGGTEDEGSDELVFQVQVEGEVDVPAGEGDPLDAELELPAIESVAVAVGNNQSIESAVSTQLHDAQILFDVEDENGTDPTPVPLLQSNGEGGNAHTDLAVAATLAAALGFIDKADISASSEVYNILNATVESSATAVGNNMNVDLSEAPVGDQLLIADITQFAYADVSATSYVHDVWINNYNNLGAVSPIVSSTATAIGNNLSVNVGVPDANGE